MNNRLTITAIITSVILLSGTLGFVISSNDAFAGGLPPREEVSLDHYLSYDVKEPKNTLKFVPRTVILSDQFGEETYQVKKPVKLYNPVDKNGEGIIDIVTHLVGYKIKGPHEPVTDIRVVNQFGELFVNTMKADLLLVPSQKSLDGPVGRLVLISDVHFKCYKVEVISGFEQLTVRLADQFQDKQFKVIEPTRLCNPVEKNGEGIRDFDAHLMCYKLEMKIWTTNQFEPEVFDLKTVNELCVPSEKNPEPPLAPTNLQTCQCIVEALCPPEGCPPIIESVCITTCDEESLGACASLCPGVVVGVIDLGCEENLEACGP